MVSRRRAREAALQALYQCDTLGEWSRETIDLYFSVFCGNNHDEDAPAGGKPEAAIANEKVLRLKQLEVENSEFARSLAVGVSEHRDFVDRQIAAASTNWSLARMARVDRNILRVACYEMAYLADIPINVSINEAIEIAKNYGTEDSAMFVNGVLDNIAHAFSNNPALTLAGPERERRKNLAA